MTNAVDLEDAQHNKVLLTKSAHESVQDHTVLSAFHTRTPTECYVLLIEEHVPTF